MDSTAQRVIDRGNIYWVAQATDEGPETAIPHPYIVVQDDVFNHSRIHTVVVCALTSNLRRASETPGNVLLDPGEGVFLGRAWSRSPRYPASRKHS